jgi:hypothetical protein
MSRRDIPMRHRLEIEYIQRIGGAGNQTFVGMRPRSFRKRPPEIPKAGIQRARGQKSHESTPSIHTSANLKLSPPKFIPTSIYRS